MTTVWDHDDSDSPVAELDEAHCWELVRRASFGRLGYQLAGEVNIVPINAVVDGSRLVFRTAEGSKLLGIHMSHDVVYEVDEIDQETATSVVARGKARVLQGGEEEKAEDLGLLPLSSTWKSTFVAIEVSEITGRRFRLAH